MIYLYFIALAVAFALLFKCADYCVDGSCEIARVLSIPKIVVGIVLVSLATTAPEFGVSVMAAFLGNPEIALGNAIGSVICDDGIALALAAVLAPTVIFINCRILKTTGIFLLFIDFLAYLLARNGTLGRVEGIAFILILILYFTFVLKNPSLGIGVESQENVNSNDGKKDSSLSIKSRLKRPIIIFSGGVAGIAVGSLIINWAAVHIAEHFLISETIMGLTIVAIGTSLPEISTCITAVLKGEGELAVGNILGADILNILWIIGVASIVRPIQVELKVINFTFPYMILIVTVMLVSMRIGCRLGKIKGLILFWDVSVVFVFDA